MSEPSSTRLRPTEAIREVLTEEQITFLITDAGHHAIAWGAKPAPADRDGALLYALAECIDFDCCGRQCHTELDEETVKRFLLMYKSEVPFITTLGVFAGRFDFMRGED